MATKETTINLCECGCGQPAPIATRNWHSKGIKKGQSLRFVCGHHRRGKVQSVQEKIKRSNSWGTREASFSPFLPNRIVRFAADQNRWYCSNPNKPSSSIPHAKAVYEHYFGTVANNWAVHHKNGHSQSLQDDHPDNLLAVPKIWNWHYFPYLSKGFNVPETIVTDCYIELKDQVDENDLFCAVCKKLIAIVES